MNPQLQQWIQWLGAIILIPALAVIFWQVFENKTDIAVMKEIAKAQAEVSERTYDKVEEIDRYLRQFELK